MTGLTSMIAASRYTPMTGSKVGTGISLFEASIKVNRPPPIDTCGGMAEPRLADSTPPISGVCRFCKCAGSWAWVMSAPVDIEAGILAQRHARRQLAVMLVHVGAHGLDADR